MLDYKDPPHTCACVRCETCFYLGHGHWALQSTLKKLSKVVTHSTPKMKQSVDPKEVLALQGHNPGPDQTGDIKNISPAVSAAPVSTKQWAGPPDTITYRQASAPKPQSNQDGLYNSLPTVGLASTEMQSALYTDSTTVHPQLGSAT